MTLHYGKQQSSIFRYPLQKTELKTGNDYEKI